MNDFDMVYLVTQARSKIEQKRAKINFILCVLNLPRVSVYMHHQRSLFYSFKKNIIAICQWLIAIIFFLRRRKRSKYCLFLRRHLTFSKPTKQASLKRQTAQINSIYNFFYCTKKKKKKERVTTHQENVINNSKQNTDELLLVYCMRECFFFPFDSLSSHDLAQKRRRRPISSICAHAFRKSSSFISFFHHFVLAFSLLTCLMLILCNNQGDLSENGLSIFSTFFFLVLTFTMDDLLVRIRFQAKAKQQQQREKKK